MWLYWRSLSNGPVFDLVMGMMEEQRCACIEERSSKMSMLKVWAAAGGHVDLHSLYCHLRQCWHLWTMLPHRVCVWGEACLGPRSCYTIHVSCGLWCYQRPCRCLCSDPPHKALLISVDHAARSGHVSVMLISVAHITKKAMHMYLVFAASEAFLMSVGHAAFRNHAEVNGSCCWQGPCWGFMVLQQLGAELISVSDPCYHWMY